MHIYIMYRSDRDRGPGAKLCLCPGLGIACVALPPCRYGRMKRRQASLKHGMEAFLVAYRHTLHYAPVGSRRLAVRESAGEAS